MKKWWDMETYASVCDVSGRSKGEKRALSILERTTKHNGERYEVGLMWADDNPDLPNNYYSAYQQFLSMEKRFEKDLELKEAYKATIEKDLENHFIRKLDQEEVSSTENDMQWYLPHHPVKHPHKPGKVRGVCNAASKFRCVSLNDKLLSGPELLRNLVGIVCRFKDHLIAITADIESMFLQVAVPKEECRVLRFLWRDKPEDNIGIFEYNRHVFGAKSSPTCANYGFQQGGRDNKKEFPVAAATIDRNFYMDDLVKSVDTPQEAIECYQQLVETLKRSGYTLKKWVSNCPEVLEVIPSEDHLESNEFTLNADSSPILCLEWTIDSDSLQVCRGPNKECPQEITQRVVLSFVSSVFDPMGIFAPFTMRMRMLLKRIWIRFGQSWDENINEEDKRIFFEWVQEMQTIKQTSLSRKYFSNIPKNVQLHIFSDASLEAMCIVAYLRGELEDGIEVSFVLGKCRIAPIKQLSIPRLELQAALYSVRLRKLIIQEHDLPINGVTHWTDSVTVLQWLNSANKKQNVFVANRAAEILENSSIDEWKHIRGELNPSDIGTRGITIEKLSESEWLTGPSWLKDQPEDWPLSLSPIHVNSDDHAEVALIANTSMTQEPPVDWKKISSFSKCVRVIAFCLRLKYKSQSKVLLVEELNRSEERVLKMIQKESFPDLFDEKESFGKTKKGGNLSKFAPFFDEKGVIRIRGRIKHANLSFEQRHPVLLSTKHDMVMTMLRDLHFEHNHEGVEYVRSVIQQKFWIIGLRNALRSVKTSCVFCRKLRAQNKTPFMADLPPERPDYQSYPFTNVVVDYFGPFEVKLLRRSMKRWCCLFTCLTTRAVHIEVVRSLDTDSCLVAINRFIARRASRLLSSAIIGTNFVGSARELEEYINSWNQDQITPELAQKHIVWKFNPPGAPHFGGVWERLVRSCKKAMVAILGNRSLTDEVLLTTMCLVEQTLNARPITPASDDPEDLEPLTPNHFIIGRANVCIPFIPNAEVYANQRKMFRSSQAYADMIWNRWVNEYLI